MFRGITAVTLDAKGRLAVPMRYREALVSPNHTHLILTIDTDETCLLLYPMGQWQVIEAKLEVLPSFNSTARRIQRLLLGHATELEPDSNGRLLIPPLLRDYAGLNKHTVLVGQGNKFEIWDEELWQKKRKQWLDEEGLNEGLPEEMKNLSL